MGDGNEIGKPFYPIVLGILFDPETKKILIGKRKKDENIKELTWAFPGGRPEYGEELEDSIKREIKEETNYDAESLGVIHAKTYPEKRDLLSIYFLCELTGGEGNPQDDFDEIKWVEPSEIENYFSTSFHPRLKEYIEGLKYPGQ
ncbi:MAG: NUDIX hydrolase [Candidatus Pacearchaeota archaeon]